MAIAFPSSPTIGQEYTYKNLTYVYTAASTWSLKKSALQDTTDASALNASDNIALGGMTITRTVADVTLATDGATTSTGITPAGVIMGASLIVTTAIAGLDAADHHIQLGVSGTTDKYIDVANGSSATSIAQNTKDSYTLTPSAGVETAELILTITGGADQTPTAGAVKLEIIHLAQTDLADVA